MLSWEFVIQRVKEELSLPFQELEKSDEEIKDYLQRNALKKFCNYFPEKWRMTIDTTDEDIQVPDRTSEFYIVDPDDREIYNITEFIPQLGESLMTNHSFMGAWHFDEVREHVLQNFQANNLKPFSNYNYTTEFMPPNRFRVSPKWEGTATIAYERAHDPEISTIGPEFHDIFIDLSFGMFAMMIGRIRKKYQNIQTPFGEVQINADEIYNDGKEVYDRTIEKMTAGSLPNVVFDHG